MGHTYTAHSFIGIRIPQEKIQKKSMVRGCSHDISSEMKFCSSCGKAMWKESWEWVLDPTEDNPENRKNSVYVFYHDYTQENWFVCLRSQQVPGRWGTENASSDGPSFVRVSLTDHAVQIARVELKTLLDPLGLWEEGEFGLWSLLN